MAGGGVLSGSTTLVVGAPGAGKTLLGFQFLNAGAQLGEPGLHVGFYEPPPRLIDRAEVLGIPLGADMKKGVLELMWRPTPELMAETLVEELFKTIQDRGVRRLVIDGMDRLIDAVIYPERKGPFFAAVADQLRSRNVTALFTIESPSFLEPSAEPQMGGISPLTENLILLRYMERNSELHRVISILKMREGSFDSSLRRLSVGKRGLEVGERWGSGSREPASSKKPSSKVGHAKRPTGSRKS
jgi:circadian clock protein KaiC